MQSKAKADAVTASAMTVAAASAARPLVIQLPPQ
jgi:hypothetical protein